MTPKTCASSAICDVMCVCVCVCVCGVASPWVVNISFAHRCRVRQDGFNWPLPIQWSFQFGCSVWLRLLAKGDHVTCIRQWCKYKYKCVCVYVYVYVVCVCRCVSLCVQVCMCVCVCVCMCVSMCVCQYVCMSVLAFVSHWPRLCSANKHMYRLSQLLLNNFLRVMWLACHARTLP